MARKRLKAGVLRAVALAVTPVVLLAAGCTSGSVTANPSNGTFTIAPGTASIDTNCTGCNATSAAGTAVEQFSATLTGGGSAGVKWTLSGGDPNSGPGTISTSGAYTPPSYLTANSDTVTVTATLASNANVTASAVLTLTPGFLEPMAPENVALGANGTITFTGYIAEAGGGASINYSLASTAAGAGSGQGTLGLTHCQRSVTTFTTCTVTYTAPAAISATAATYLVATIGSISKTSAEVLLNTEGVSSNPTAHQAEESTPITLGSSGGNNNDYDTSGNQIVDCCSGTLGSLIQNNSGTQYLLSANHVLARSDQASVGDMIVQPGLIDNNCTPNGEGAGTTPVGSLTSWVPLSATTTDVDAAIAQVDSGAVNTSGDILELGTMQGNGQLAAAPPGISSTGGRGETATVNMTVAKSGRTTGLTCANVSATNLDIYVDYYLNCAETQPYMTKTFTNQVAISGNQFSDAGDSGSLVVDASDAEPVGLFFAGGTDVSGVSQGVANPVGEVLSELGTQAGNGTSYTFVGGADHAVSCLNYGASTVNAAQGRTLTDAETGRAQTALGEARMLVNPAMGVLGVATGKSNDAPGRAAVIVYTDAARAVSVPATVNGVRTLVIPTSAEAVANGSAPLTPVMAGGNLPGLQAAVLNAAVTAKNQVSLALMKQNPAFFGVGVGQSYDDPAEAVLVIYVDRKRIPAQLPATVNGLRTRYVVMDRLHVTRAYATGVQSRSHCVPHAAPAAASWFDQLDRKKIEALY